MARIYGTIESLKSLKHELAKNGITQFKSVKEISIFLSTYRSQKLDILTCTSKKLEKDYLDSCSNLKQNLQKKTEIKIEQTKLIDKQIFDLQSKIDSIRIKKAGFLKGLFFRVQKPTLKKQLNYLIKNKTLMINTSVKEVTQKIENDLIFLKKYETAKQDLLLERASADIKKLDKTYNILEQSKNLISGAIGENLVVKEIQKLSDDYVLINDFTLSFPRPIFFKKYKQRIYSIQIDHLLITKAGIFIIETKNWSKSSVNSISLRSPIEQIERSNYALYVYISKHFALNKHHWGEQKVPIRNLIVMINNKPKEQFKYVTIKLLKELNDYIKYFEPVLSDRQLNKIVKGLI